MITNTHLRFNITIGGEVIQFISFVIRRWQVILYAILNCTNLFTRNQLPEPNN